MTKTALWVFTAAVMLVGSACSASPDVIAEPDSSIPSAPTVSSSHPPTTVPVTQTEVTDTTSTTAEDTIVVDTGVCPNFVTEVATGPEIIDEDEFGPVSMEQQRLTNDIDTIDRYGDAHPDMFGSSRFENAPWVRIVVGFTGDLEAHCLALRELLEFPDEFQLIQQEISERELQAIYAEITTLVRDTSSSGSIAMGAGPPIFVQLSADAEDLAAELVERYGDTVKISVGALPYPDPTVATDFDCRGFEGEIGAGDVVDGDLVATLSLEETTVASGGDFSGTATVTNTGTAELAFASGEPLVAIVFRPGTNDPVGLYVGGIDGVGTGADLPPGESISIRVIGGTASCDPTLGYALPAGDYDVRVYVPWDTYPSDNAPVVTTYLLTDPVTLTIQEAANGIEAVQIDGVWVFSHDPMAWEAALHGGLPEIVDGCLVIGDMIVVWHVDEMDEAAAAVTAAKAGESPQLLIGGGGFGLDQAADPSRIPPVIADRCTTRAVWFGAP